MYYRLCQDREDQTSGCSDDMPGLTLSRAVKKLIQVGTTALSNYGRYSTGDPKMPFFDENRIVAARVRCVGADLSPQIPRPKHWIVRDSAAVFANLTQ